MRFDMCRFGHGKFMFCLSAAILMTQCGVCLAGDWAYWRGPEQNGVCRELGLLEKWDFKTNENVLWKSDVGGRATPVILNGRVYLN